MSAVSNNLDRGSDSPLVIDLARQLVKISQSLEDVERDDAEAPSWNQVFFHSPPLNEENAAHWLRTAMDGAHSGQVVPLSACLIIFSQWMLRLEGEKRNREQIFIELYYKKTLGYTNKPHESDLMLATRAEVDLASRRRMLTLRDIAPVTANQRGTMLLSEQAVDVHAGETWSVDVAGRTHLAVFLRLRFTDPALKDMPSYSVLQNILNNMVSGEINAFIDANARRVGELNKEISQNKAVANAFIERVTRGMKADDYERDPLDLFTGVLDKVGKVVWVTQLINDRIKTWSATDKNKDNALAAFEAAKAGFLTEVNATLNASALKEQKKLDIAADKAVIDIEAKVTGLRNAWDLSKFQQRKGIRGIASPFLRLSIKFPIFPIASTSGPAGIRSSVAYAVTQELKYQLSRDANLSFVFTDNKGLKDEPLDNHPEFFTLDGVKPPAKLKIVPLGTAHPHVTRDINDHEIEIDGKRLILDPNDPGVYKKLVEHDDAKLAEPKKDDLRLEKDQKKSKLGALQDEVSRMDKKMHDMELAQARNIDDLNTREAALERIQKSFEEKTKEREAQNAAHFNQLDEEHETDVARLDALNSGLGDAEASLKKVSDKEKEAASDLTNVIDEIEKRRQADKTEFNKFLEENKPATPPAPSTEPARYRASSGSNFFPTGLHG